MIVTHVFIRLVIGKKNRCHQAISSSRLRVFSEENIWKLCELWKNKDPTDLPYLSAVFISNERRQIPIWEQKSANNDERIVIWVTTVCFSLIWPQFFISFDFIFAKDYHVILVDKSSSPALIYDFDTNLAFPSDASNYLLRAIRSETGISSRYHRYHVFQACLSVFLSIFICFFLL